MRWSLVAAAVILLGFGAAAWVRAHPAAVIEDRRPVCQTAAAWKHAVGTRDAALAATIEAGMATRTVDSYATTVAAIDGALTAGEPAPTVLVEWWGAYRTAMEWSRDRMATAGAGQRIEAAETEPLAALQDGPLATAVAWCGGA